MHVCYFFKIHQQYQISPCLLTRSGGDGTKMLGVLGYQSFLCSEETSRTEILHLRIIAFYLFHSLMHTLNIYCTLLTSRPLKKIKSSNITLEGSYSSLHKTVLVPFSKWLRSEDNLSSIFQMSAPFPARLMNRM